MRYVIVAIFALIVVGCQRRPQVDPLFGWPAVEAGADSIIVALDRGFASGVGNDSLWTLVGRLHTEAVKGSGNTQLMARYHYWRSRLLNRRRNRVDAIREAEEALALSDSARYPYDRARFRHLSVVLSDASRLNKYDALKRLADFYSSTSDNLMLAHAYLDVAHILKDVGDLEHAYNYYSTADSLYGILGLKDYHLKTQLNNAEILSDMGRADDSRAIFSRLLADSTARADFDFYNIVALSASEAFDDVGMMKRCLSEISGRSGYATRSAEAEVAIAQYYMEHNQPDSARRYGEMALRRTPADLALSAAIARIGLQIYRDRPDLDSMVKYADRYIACRDSIDKVARREDIRGSESRSEIARRDELARTRRYSDRLIMWMVVVAVAFVAMVAVSLLLRRNHRHRLEVARAQLERERESRKLVTASLSMAEKDNAMQTVLTDVGRMKREGAGSSDLRMIEQTIRMHLNNKDEMENIAALFEKVHPDFVRRLKARYPGVSEGDIRLAVYISVGMTTKQIAKMLLIQPASVKMNRHRLRERMNLSADETLEDILREIAGEAPDYSARER